jgi:hypothetical protein
MPGIDVSLQFGSWRPHSVYWNICSRDHIYDRNLAAAIERPDRIANVVNRISIINNFNKTNTHNLYYSKGPDVHEVQKYVNRRIDQTSIKDVNKIAQVRHNGNVMNVYRPGIQDPKETLRQHPQQILQPGEFRRADAAQANPIRTEEQRPIRQSSEQRNNVERLPVFHSGAASSAGNGGGSRSNSGGGGQHHGRN